VGQPLQLGIEGGGTKTTVLLSTGQRFTLGPLNLQLATDRQLLAAFRSAISNLKSPISHATICLAGCRTAADHARLRALARRVWPRAKITTGNDLDSGLAAAFGPSDPGILVLSGTGSVVIGRNKNRRARAGGWGHLLGDHGSGYALAISNLQSQISQFDRTGKTSSHLRRVLRRLCLNTPDQLIPWIHNATKNDIAALLPDLITADRRILREQAALLADDVRAVACKLRLRNPDIVLAGGVFRNRPPFVRAFRAALPGRRIRLLETDTASGTLALPPSEISNLKSPIPPLPLTEQRNPRTLDLDKKSIPQLIDTMLAEESRVIPAIRANRRSIENAIRAIVTGFRRGGRLFYVGAGTSGRLGVLDASECPPTFSTNPEMVQGIIAGGVNALHSAVEAAEDDPLAGAEAIRHRAVGKHDVVVGIAASGQTPFMLGALDEAKRRGAKTFLLTCSQIVSRHSLIAIRTGPEILTGSTRLKAGTATKLVLNMLTTISMIRLGKVISNLMVDVKPTNEKLRARACRIVAALRPCDEQEARRRLVKTGWNVKKAATT
jgi:N-acetylmuramic acid 6-phosphate etherase